MATEDNKISPQMKELDARQQLLVVTMEECGELVQSCSKLLRRAELYSDGEYVQNLKEELGDVLLQVMLHSQIAEERGAFSFADVVKDIDEKMIRRNPHVFATAKAENTDEVDNNWEKIKKAEKERIKSLRANK